MAAAVLQGHDDPSADLLYDAGPLMRRLLCTRRRVALDIVDDYLLAWLALRNAAAQAGARAWLFRGAANEDHFMEFMEWNDGEAEPLEEEGVMAAVTQLGAFGVALSSDEWEEAT
jgi:hypothetical protein